MLKHVVLIAAALSFATASQAQQGAADYPNKPIKMIVTVPAGGGVDTVTRLLTDKLRQKWGQPVVIENRAGAAGNIGAEAVFVSEPDGYTLMASQPAPLTVNQVLYQKLNFDPTALEPVMVMSHIPNVLLVRKDLPVKTAAEFIAYAKANPGKLNFASQGPGTTSHLTAELFGSLTGTKLVHVPYKGTSPALNDIVAGHVDFIFMELASANKLHQAGNARILATATEKRLDALPDIPTMAEVGVANFVSDTWNAISAPPKTPREIIAKLNAALNHVLKEPDVQAKFKSINLLPGGGTPQDMAKLVREETKRWGDVVKSANVPLN
jgi:tripartite-type tricarboxylate transporter receptor subunit TctC